LRETRKLRVVSELPHSRQGLERRKHVFSGGSLKTVEPVPRQIFPQKNLAEGEYP
jgi:hypothetical protein